MKAALFATGLIVLGAPLAAKTDDKPMARAEVFQKVLDCRAIADGAARLACYDAQVAKLDEAAARKDVVIVDQAEVKRTRRGLFGFNIGDIGIFGRDDKDGESEEFNQIESTIETAHQDSFGKWIIVIADGARWIQIDNTSIRRPKAGQSIRIRKGSLGSYFANVNDQHAIRMIRQN